MTEEKNENENEMEETGSISTWLQENLRIIISIVIVLAIAGGIYSYSKRSQEDLAMNDDDETTFDENFIGLEKDNTADLSEAEEPAKENVKKEAATDEQVTSVSTSKETEVSFVETAKKGEGATHLARRALANYLEKNPDSGLTKEHKIYIEDYLRKKVGNQGRTYVGTSMEFSKDLIKEAIERSKQLNERQLKNLEKYSASVSNLS